MDFIIDLPKSEGKNVIMVVVDKLTKYAHFCALSRPFNTSTISATFMETINRVERNIEQIMMERNGGKKY